MREGGLGRVMGGVLCTCEVSSGGSLLRSGFENMIRGVYEVYICCTIFGKVLKYQPFL